MTRASKKMLATIITAIFAAGAAAGYWVPPVVKNGNGVAELRTQHTQDITVLREQIVGLRGLLDTLLVKTSASESKLDMLVGMVRDHTQKDK